MTLGDVDHILADVERRLASFSTSLSPGTISAIQTWHQRAGRHQAPRCRSPRRDRRQRRRNGLAVSATSRFRLLELRHTAAARMTTFVSTPLWARMACRRSTRIGVVIVDEAGGVERALRPWPGRRRSASRGFAAGAQRGMFFRGIRAASPPRSTSAIFSRAVRVKAVLVSMPVGRGAASAPNLPLRSVFVSSRVVKGTLPLRASMARATQHEMREIEIELIGGT